MRQRKPRCHAWILIYRTRPIACDQGARFLDWKKKSWVTFFLCYHSLVLGKHWPQKHIFEAFVGSLNLILPYKRQRITDLRLSGWRSRYPRYCVAMGSHTAIVTPLISMNDAGWVSVDLNTSREFFSGNCDSHHQIWLRVCVTNYRHYEKETIMNNSQKTQIGSVMGSKR